jgi:hypothetical protein
MFRILLYSITSLIDRPRAIKTKSVFTISVLLLVLFLFGCSQVPQPSTYGYSKQKKMQAAHHWQILAEDVADQVKTGLYGTDFGYDIPIYISHGDGTPFDYVFHSLLTSEFLNRKIHVSTKKQGSIEMKVDAKILTHNSREVHYPAHKWTALAIGVNVLRAAYRSSLEHVIAAAIPAGIVADAAFASNAGEIPSNEVIISTSLDYNDKVIIHNVDIYYINEPDWWHYDNNPYKKDTNTKTYKTVSY